MIRNLGPDFVYASAQDGFFPAVPAEDSAGLPHDFSDSATLVGADELDLDRTGRLRPVPRHEPSGDPRVADDLGRDARVPERRQVGARGRADHLQRRRPSTATQAVAES